MHLTALGGGEYANVHCLPAVDVVHQHKYGHNVPTVKSQSMTVGVIVVGRVDAEFEVSCQLVHVLDFTRTQRVSNIEPNWNSGKYVVKMTQATKKHLSKKTKGGWRKIEHKDVDDFLDDQRLEERMG